MRLLTALAQLEGGDPTQDVLVAVEHNMSAVEEVVVAADRDIGAAVTTLRHELRRVVLR